MCLRASSSLKRVKVDYEHLEARRVQLGEYLRAVLDDPKLAGV